MKKILCTYCGIKKPQNDFYLRKERPGAYRTECKSCISINNRIRKHGVSIEDYQSMKNNQQGVCAICNNPEETLSVDHDHKTGKVRGLLCQKCNKALGLFQDSLSNLHNAIVYLEEASKS